MAANYLHGVETIEVDQGARPVLVVKSSVIALVGLAPMGPTNQPILVLSPNDAALSLSTKNRNHFPLHFPTQNRRRRSEAATYRLPATDDDDDDDRRRLSLSSLLPPTLN